MNQPLQSFFCLFLLALFTGSLSAQASGEIADAIPMKTDFSDRQAILTTLENFYIGDHTGSVEHMKLSMHEKGAYRYINRDGEYSVSVFDLESGHADTNYKEELLSIEIYERLAIARLRLEQHKMDRTEYKVMTLHKDATETWKITGISWGFGITQ
ncbi:MAG: hypothetical protein AB8F78_15445 [Saprospiraceae bacterium]